METTPVTDETTPAQEKARLRQFLKQKRRELPQRLRPEYDRAIRERLLEQAAPAGTVFCYVSTEMEVDTRGIIDCLRRSGITVLIPRILNRDKMIAVEFGGWHSLGVGQLGILTPDTEKEWPGEADLCITPAWVLPRTAGVSVTAGAIMTSGLPRIPGARGWRCVMNARSWMICRSPVQTCGWRRSSRRSESSVVRDQGPVPDVYVPTRLRAANR